MKVFLVFFMVLTVSKAIAWNDVLQGAILNKIYNCSSSQAQFSTIILNNAPSLSIIFYYKPMGLYLPAFEHLYFLSEGPKVSDRTYQLVPMYLNSRESLYQTVDQSGRQTGYVARYFERTDTFEVYPISRKFTYYCQ